MSILIVNGRVVTPEAGSRRRPAHRWRDHRGGRTRSPRHGQTVIDASGRWVIPGGVDVHTHLDAPVGGTVSSDDFETGTRRRLLGGTTCIVDFRYPATGRTARGHAGAWHARLRATVDYGLHMIVVDLPEGRTAELRETVEAGVTSFKVFMAYPGVLMLDDAAILRVLREAASARRPRLCPRGEWPAIAGLTAKALAAGYTSPVYHALTRPRRTEAEATRRAILSVGKARRAVYVVHVSLAWRSDEITVPRDARTPWFGETVLITFC